jgi:magnesium-transporting ATPase (P-type)
VRLLANQYRPFFLAAQLCQDIKEGEQHGKKFLFGDPMEIALVDMAQQVLPMLPAYRRLDEIPFDAERMQMRVDGGNRIFGFSSLAL